MQTNNEIRLADLYIPLVSDFSLSYIFIDELNMRVGGLPAFPLQALITLCSQQTIKPEASVSNQRINQI
jgi:hypothetical protein